MSDGCNNNVSILDVFIRDEQVERVKHYTEHVRRLYGVECSFATTNNKQFMPMAGSWLDLQSSCHESVMNAREYVKGLSAPEEIVRLRFPPPVYDLLCGGKEGENITKLERDTAANIRFNSLEEVEISGSIASVTKATSIVEEVVKTFIEENNNTEYDETCSVGRDSGIYVKCNPDCYHDTHSDLSYNENRTSVLTVDEDISLSRDSLLDHRNEPTNETRRSQDDAELMEYARKLGYSDSQVKSAMKKLGPDTVDQNDLLHELIKAANSKRDGQFFGDEGSTDLTAFYETVTAPPNADNTFLRHIVVDGSNVAMSHGNNQVFSCRGIAIVVNWFRKRGHAVTVFVPNWRNEASKQGSPIIDQEILTRLNDEGVVSFTPSRRIEGKLIQSYDDLYIIRLAVAVDGIIVSNDHFRDIRRDVQEWRDFINKRLLMYTFAGDIFMPPDDPLGRHGPKLNDFLRKDVEKRGLQHCTYGRKCTFGPKCKYYHPERRASGSFVKKPLPPLPNQNRPRSDPGQNAAASADNKQRPISLPNLEQLYVSPPHSLQRYIYVQNNNFQRPVSGPPFPETSGAPVVYNQSEPRTSMEYILKQQQNTPSAQAMQNRKYSGDYSHFQYVMVPPPNCRPPSGEFANAPHGTPPNKHAPPPAMPGQGVDCVGRPLSSDFSSRPSSGEYSYSGGSRPPSGDYGRPPSGDYGNNSRPSSGDYGAQWTMMYQRQYNSHGNFYPVKNYYKSRNTPTLPDTQEEPRQVQSSLKIEIVEQLRELYPEQYDKILWVLRTYPDIKTIEDAIPIINDSNP